MYYIHKYEVAQAYGGPEEGGWWYDTGIPVEDWQPLQIAEEDQAYFVCRALNHEEKERAKEEEEYGYTSVLSYKSEHFSYDVTEVCYPQAYPANRPHYE